MKTIVPSLNSSLFELRVHLSHVHTCSHMCSGLGINSWSYHEKRINTLYTHNHTRTCKLYSFQSKIWHKYMVTFAGTGIWTHDLLTLISLPWPTCWIGISLTSHLRIIGSQRSLGDLASWPRGCVSNRVGFNHSSDLPGPPKRSIII